MAFEVDQADDGGDDGAPKWMTTFGDAITLLVTFFVLLLTYSTPNERDLQRMSSGFLGKGGGPGTMGKRGASPIKVPQTKLSNSKEALSRTQFPPLYKKLSEEAKSAPHEDIDVSMLPEVTNVVVVRLSLDQIFGDDGNISRKGDGVLKKIASVLEPFPRVVVVRSAPEDGKVEKVGEPLAVSQRIIARLKEPLDSKEFDFRVSPDIGLSEDPLESGQCEILMLQQ